MPPSAGGLWDGVMMMPSESPVERPRFDRSAEMDSGRLAGPGGLDVELAQEVGKRKRFKRAIDHETHGAIRAVGAHVDHRLHKARILHAGHGDQQLPGEVRLDIGLDRFCFGHWTYPCLIFRVRPIISPQIPSEIMAQA